MKPKFDMFRIDKKTLKVKNIGKCKLNPSVYKNWFDIASPYFNSLTYYDSAKHCFYFSAEGFCDKAKVGKTLKKNVEFALINEIRRIRDNVLDSIVQRTITESRAFRPYSIYEVHYCLFAKDMILIESKTSSEYLIYKTIKYSSRPNGAKAERVVAVCAAPENSKMQHVHFFEESKFNKYFKINKKDSLVEIADKVMKLIFSIQNVAKCLDLFVPHSKYDYVTYVLGNPFLLEFNKRHDKKKITYLPDDYIKKLTNKK